VPVLVLLCEIARYLVDWHGEYYAFALKEEAREFLRERLGTETVEARPCQQSPLPPPFFGEKSLKISELPRNVPGNTQTQAQNPAQNLVFQLAESDDIVVCCDAERGCNITRLERGMRGGWLWRDPEHSIRERARLELWRYHAKEVSDEKPAQVTAATPAALPRQKLVPVYMLAMHLPTEDVVAVHRTESDESSTRRVKEWSGDRARITREIESLRRQAYRRIKRLWCMVREFSIWVAVTEDGIREAERLSAEVRQKLAELGLKDVADRYHVRALRVYMEPRDARTLMDAAIRQLRGEIEELERRIKDAEAEQNKRLVKELARKREYVNALLETSRKYLESLA
jgi:hypothetical protein